MMNHRCSERTDTSVPALLRVRGGWLPAKIRNVSEGGMYVEMTNRQSIPSYVVVGVKPAGSRRDRLQEFPAMVIHRQGNGIGLMLAGNDEEARSKTQLLQADGRQATTSGLARLVVGKSLCRQLFLPSDKSV